MINFIYKKPINTDLIDLIIEMTTKTIPNTVKVVEKLRWNAHLNKHIHFNASKRDRNHHIWVGVPIVIITVFLSFLLAISGADSMAVRVDSEKSTTQFPNQNSEKQSLLLRNIDLPIWAELIGALLALFAAALSSIQTFFNFQKEYEGHRQIGNEYLTVARECERLIALFFDGLLELSDLAQMLEHLNSKYVEINARSETLNVNDQDYKRAKKFQESKDEIEPSLVQMICKEGLQSQNSTNYQGIPNIET